MFVGGLGGDEPSWGFMGVSIAEPDRRGLGKTCRRVRGMNVIASRRRAQVAQYIGGVRRAFSVLRSWVPPQGHPLSHRCSAPTVGELIGKAGELKKAGARWCSCTLDPPGPWIRGQAEGTRQRAREGEGLPAHFTLVLDPDYTFTNPYGLRWDAKNETAYPSMFVLDGKRKVTFSKTHGGRAKTEEVLKAILAKSRPFAKRTAAEQRGIGQNQGRRFATPDRRQGRLCSALVLQWGTRQLWESLMSRFGLCVVVWVILASPMLQ